MLRSFFCKFSLETGTIFVLWMSLCTGITTMLSPSQNVTYSIKYPPKEYWESLQQMQNNWLNYLKNQQSLTLAWFKNVTEVHEEPWNFTSTESQTIQTSSENSIPTTWQYPEPGETASEVTLGVSWMNIPLGFIQVLVSGYGLYGMYEERNAKYLFPYLVWSVAYPAMNFLIGLFSPMGTMVLAYLISLVQLGLYIYFVMVVYSYYTTWKLKRYNRNLNSL